MKLKPSLRQKKRYLLLDLQAKRRLPSSAIEQSVMSSITNFSGAFGMSKIQPKFAICKQKNRCILKVAHTAVDQTIAAMLFIKTIKNTPVLPSCITVSGSLKKIRGLTHETTTTND